MNVQAILRSKGNTVVTVKPDTPLIDVARRLAEARIGAVVVSPDRIRVAGILSERDIIAALAEHGADALSLPAAEVMTREVTTCTPADRVGELMAVMTEERIRHLPVIDDGALGGIISIGDVVKCRVQEIESEADALRSYVTQG